MHEVFVARYGALIGALASIDPDTFRVSFQKAAAHWADCGMVTTAEKCLTVARAARELTDATIVPVAPESIITGKARK